MTLKKLALAALIATLSHISFADDELDVAGLEEPSRLPDTAAVAPVSQLKFDIDLTEPKKTSKSHLKVTLRKLDARVRVEVEGFGLKGGKYAVISTKSCYGSVKAGKTMTKERYESIGYELHRFSTDSGNIYTEQSKKDLTMADGKAEKDLNGRSVVFFQLKQGEVISLGCLKAANGEDNSGVAVGAAEGLAD